MSFHQTLKDSNNVTSSPESGCGVTLSALPGGLTIAKSGQALAPASLSARQAKELGLLTSGTCGQPGFTSLNSAILRLSLENRLKQRSATAGSTLFTLTWKEAVTPSERPVSLLRALARRTSDPGCSSWPTPQAFDATNDGGTPRALRFKGNAPSEQKHKRNPNTPGSYRGDLKDYAGLASWLTPSANEDAAGNPGAKMQAMLGSQVKLVASGPTQTGCTAATPSIGQLNPAHPRWLMGLPTVWDDCAVMVTLSSRRSRKRS
jgi:hypothetical protein